MIVIKREMKLVIIVRVWPYRIIMVCINIVIDKFGLILYFRKYHSIIIYTHIVIIHVIIIHDAIVIDVIINWSDIIIC